VNGGDVPEWFRERSAKPRTRVRFPSSPPLITCLMVSVLASGCEAPRQTSTVDAVDEMCVAEAADCVEILDVLRRVAEVVAPAMRIEEVACSAVDLDVLDQMRAECWLASFADGQLFQGVRRAPGAPIELTRR
jgi:hypothetical protein